MENEQIAITLTKHGEEIASLKHRVNDCENFQQDINKLALSIHDLASSVSQMCGRQDRQEGRLERLEAEPADNAKYYRRLIIGCAITTIIGALVGGIVGFII